MQDLTEALHKEDIPLQEFWDVRSDKVKSLHKLYQILW